MPGYIVLPVITGRINSISVFIRSDEADAGNTKVVFYCSKQRIALGYGLSISSCKYGIRIEIFNKGPGLHRSDVSFIKAG